MESTKDVSLQLHSSLSGEPRSQSTHSPAKSACRWARPLGISFLLHLLAVIYHLHRPCAFKTQFKFREKAYACSTGFLKRRPVESGVSSLTRALVKLLGFPGTAGGEPQPRMLPSLRESTPPPPPQGRHPSMAFPAEKPDWTVTGTS